MKNSMALSIRKLETELDAASLIRDEIMREFRADLRHEQDRLADCEHRLALEESQCNIHKARNESLQMQLVSADNQHSELVAHGELRMYVDQKVIDDQSYRNLKKDHKENQHLLETVQKHFAEAEEREAESLRFKNAYKEPLTEFTEERMKAESSIALKTQHDEIAAAKALFQSEMDQVKEEREKEVKKLRDDL
eukprot:s894_g12.t1